VDVGRVARSSHLAHPGHGVNLNAIYRVLHIFVAFLSLSDLFCAVCFKLCVGQPYLCLPAAWVPIRLARPAGRRLQECPLSLLGRNYFIVENNRCFLRTTVGYTWLAGGG
jgi:hypothetical protein